jgi:hypothetical protein
MVVKHLEATTCSRCSAAGTSLQYWAALGRGLQSTAKRAAHVQRAKQHYITTCLPQASHTQTVLPPGATIKAALEKPDHSSTQTATKKQLNQHMNILYAVVCCTSATA